MIANAVTIETNAEVGVWEEEGEKRQTTIDIR
jgi:hypothetical protein